MNEDLMEAYTKYNKDISREVKFTLFDKNFLVEVFNHNRDLERQINDLRTHLRELDKRVTMVELEYKEV